MSRLQIRIKAILFSAFQSICLKLVKPFAKSGLSTLFPATDYSWVTWVSQIQFTHLFITWVSKTSGWRHLLRKCRDLGSHDTCLQALRPTKPQCCKPINWHLTKEASIHFINQIRCSLIHEFVFGIIFLTDFTNIDVYAAQGTTNFKW